MSENKTARIDLDKIAAEKYPDRYIPGFALFLLKKILHQDDLNNLFASAPGKKNLEFIDACLKHLSVTFNVVGLENLPPGGKGLIFVSNHPLGALDAICIGKVLGEAYGQKFKFIANEILLLIEPLRELFLPIYKHRSQSKDNIQSIKEFYETDNHLVLFPAGVTARKKGKKLVEAEWQKSFVKAAIQNQRDVVPLNFHAKNSNFFYRLENFRRFIHSKINFETLFFVHEFFKKRGKSFTLYVGKPISYQTFDDSKTHKEWAAWLRDVVTELPAAGKK